MRHIHQALSHHWVALLSWQLCSVLLCGIGILAVEASASFQLPNQKSIPFLMLSITYVLLFLVSAYPVPRSETSWWRYAVVSFAAIVGDYTGIEAYNHTSNASALLLMTTVIFWVAPLSFFMFNRKVSIWQVLALCIGMCGIVIVFLTEGNKGSRWRGNLLAVVSALSYAISTCLQEALVHDESMKLYLFRFSSVAGLTCGGLTGIVEHGIIPTCTWNTKSILLMLGYSVGLFVYDIFVPFLLQYSNATEMNLSLLTSNFFSLGFSIFFYNNKASWLYLAGFCCVPIAILIFSLTGPKEPQSTKPEESVSGSSISSHSLL